MAEKIATYIIGTSLTTGIGNGTKNNFDALLSQTSGLRPTLCVGNATVPIAAMDDPEPIAGLTRLETLMVNSIADALADVGGALDLRRTALVVSTTQGNVKQLSGELPDADSPVLLHVMARRIARAAKLDGVDIHVVSTACTSGVAAVVIASRLIRAGMYDNVIVAGGDEVTDFTTSGFLAFKSVSEKPCLPYDARRNGLSLGEAVATIVIGKNPELSKGVSIEGGAISNDANHISGPSRTGEPLAAAMRLALQQSQCPAADVSFVNTHGTATPYNDDMESKAVSVAGLSSKPVNSLKPYFGHTLGASGLIEIVMCAEQIKHQTLIGTLGFEHDGTACPLKVSGTNEKMALSRCLKSASGFGGTNAAVLLSADDVARHLPAAELVNVSPIATCKIANGKITLNGACLLDTAEPFGEFIRTAYKQLCEQNMKFYKMDNLCKLGYVGAEILLKDQEFQPQATAIVLANSSSSLDTDVRHAGALAAGQPASPATFVYTLPNIVLGEICIRHKIQGETSFFVAPKYDEDFMQKYASLLIGSGQYSAVVAGWCELAGQDYELCLTIYKKA